MLISREYALKWFPKRVKLVEKEVAIANRRAREAIKGIDFKVAVQSAKREERKRQKGRRRDRWQDVWSGVEVVANLIKEGKTRTQIIDETGYAAKTVKAYVQNARRHKLIPEDFQFNTTDRRENMLDRIHNVANLANEGKTKQEISLILNSPPGTVKSDIAYARRERWITEGLVVPEFRVRK